MVSDVAGSLRMRGHVFRQDGVVVLINCIGYFFTSYVEGEHVVVVLGILMFCFDEGLRFGCWVCWLKKKLNSRL